MPAPKKPGAQTKFFIKKQKINLTLNTVSRTVKKILILFIF
jgi:hypothetical protein